MQIDGRASVEIKFEKEVLLLTQEYAEANKGKVAVRYGSFVYCAEADDNDAAVLGNDKLQLSSNFLANRQPVRRRADGSEFPPSAFCIAKTPR